VTNSLIRSPRGIAWSAESSIGSELSFGLQYWL
jgi:hypothetical protein